jgi:hypothetical protein
LHLIYSLTALYLLDCSLDLSYPLLTFLRDRRTSLLIKEYLCFMFMSLVDLLSALGLLYLFYRMGLHSLRQQKRYPSNMHLMRGGVVAEEQGRAVLDRDMGTTSVQALLQQDDTSDVT